VLESSHHELPFSLHLLALPPLAAVMGRPPPSGGLPAPPWVRRAGQAVLRGSWSQYAIGEPWILPMNPRAAGILPAGLDASFRRQDARSTRVHGRGAGPQGARNQPCTALFHSKQRIAVEEGVEAGHGDKRP